MPKLLLTLEETVLTMNQFPGWVDDSEWINNFNKKAKDIDSLWLKYYFDSENLNIQNMYQKLCKKLRNLILLNIH